MVLPWYIAVQRENPTFVAVFLPAAQSGAVRDQPCMSIASRSWYYLAVLLVGLMPWTVIAIRALVEAMQGSMAEWKVRV
jgi:4-amino-4-deoxy-L-arabinose transferase-like glycosyltransferase